MSRDVDLLCEGQVDPRGPWAQMQKEDTMEVRPFAFTYPGDQLQGWILDGDGRRLVIGSPGSTDVGLEPMMWAFWLNPTKMEALRDAIAAAKNQMKADNDRKRLEVG